MRKQGRKDQVEAAPPPHVPFQDGRGSGVGSKPSVAPSAGMLPGLKHRVCQGRTDGLRHLGLSHEGFGILGSLHTGSPSGEWGDASFWRGQIPLGLVI